METITLNDGTVLDGRVLEDGEGRMIFVYADNMSLPEGFQLFNDPAKTSKIVAFNHGATHEYVGYTKITAINSEFGNCNLTMERSD